jgi:hypothetical protein
MSWQCTLCLFELRTRTVDSGLVQSASMRPKMPVLAMPGCAAKNSTPLTPAACARFCSSCAQQESAPFSLSCSACGPSFSLRPAQANGHESPGR